MCDDFVCNDMTVAERQLLQNVHTVFVMLCSKDSGCCNHLPHPLLWGTIDYPEGGMADPCSYGYEGLV